MKLEVLVIQENLENQTFTYEFSGYIKKHAIVKVPLKNKNVLGVVTSLNGHYKGKCREVIQVLEHLPPNCIKFLDAVAKHHHASKNKVYKLMLFRDVFSYKFQNNDQEKYQLKGSAELNPAQQKARERIVSTLGSFQRFFLYGMPGSGKTEVLFSIISEIVERGGQALILMPEISLTSQWSDRFSQIFGRHPAIWSSRQRPKLRRDIWYRAMKGEDLIVAGPRSALFLPFKNLSIIMVDEEHDKSLKQETGVFYHGRNMAVVRGMIEKCPVVLASATPSIETLHNVDLGKYERLDLTSRVKAKPTIELVNLFQMKWAVGSWISTPLRKSISQTLEKKEQVMLFINRKGYAPLIMCEACGKLTCDKCSVNLVYYSSAKEIRCHYCDSRRCFDREKELCDKCGSPFILQYPGLESVSEECIEKFPDAKIVSMSGELKIKDVKNAVDQMARGEIDIIIGTQIVAKGYHFPKLTLIGVIDGDAWRGGGELRNEENLFQMLMQLCGRVGREQLPGKVIMQTYQTDGFFIESLKNWDYFQWASAEMELRKRLAMPPFSRLMCIIFTSSSKEKAKNCGKKFEEKLKESGINSYGYAPAVIFKIKGKYRYRLLLRFSVECDFSHWVKSLKSLKNNGVKVDFDVDPYHIVS